MIISFRVATTSRPNAALTFECKLDNSAWSTCTSPKTYTDEELSSGPHTFYVRAVDEAGNVDQSPATHNWTTADTRAPNTSITEQPANPTLSTTATFRFSGSDDYSATGALTYECRLDSTAPGDFVACTNPKTYLGVGSGSHTLDVRAVDQAGNRDPSPASYTWTVNPGDTTAPDTVIGQKPPTITTDTSATIHFTSTESGSTFECKLDLGNYGTCTTPKTYTGLTVGQHTFYVKAKDGANNVDLTPASYTWTVQAPAPPANCGNPQTIAANADAWIDQGGPQANKGSDSIMKVMSKSNGNIRALVRFLLPTLPAGCEVTSAKLRLYAASAKENRTINALLVDDAWSENQVTWATAPATTGAAVSISSGSGSGYREWNVAPMVQTMYTSGEHNGFLIRDANENQDAEQQYHSREKGSDLPQLVVQFGPAAAPPPPPAGDTTPPDTLIEDGPSNSTTSTSAELNFEADEPGATFECRLDSLLESAFQACTSPKNYTGLSLGSHRFDVRAVDAAGNEDESPAVWTWTITSTPNDTLAPTTTLDLTPPATTTEKTATFRFSANETGSTFECRLDSTLESAFAACSSPATILGLTIGQHTFDVRAVDPAGNKDMTPATYTWTVEAPPPPNCGQLQTIGATADAWVEQGAPGNNKGGDSTLKITSKGGNNTRAFLKFNLPQAPQGCVLDTAMLRLYAGGAKDGRTIQALRVTGDWNEGGVNWGNQPGTAGTGATVSSGSTPGWREWDVQTLVAAMLSGSNHGFMIRDQSEDQDSEQQYNSREKGSDTPQLVIKFKAA